MAEMTVGDALRVDVEAAPYFRAQALDRLLEAAAPHDPLIIYNGGRGGSDRPRAMEPATERTILGMISSAGRDNNVRLSDTRWTRHDHEDDHAWARRREIRVAVL
jgi:hypothetical protein